jgi:hypothetical protein
MPEPGCQSLRFSGLLDSDGYRCDRPEDDDMHDPLSREVDRHPFDPTPENPDA